MLLLIPLYLIAGLVISTFVEDEDGRAPISYRIGAMLFWPLLVLYAYYIILKGKS